MTLQQAAQTALDVQDACNLSGVVRSFEEVVVNAIWPEARRLGKGTDYINTHPIVTLFLDKLTSLNQSQCSCYEDLNRFHLAYEEVKKLARS